MTTLPPEAPNPLYGILYPARESFHRQMGPPESCPRCYGSGLRYSSHPDYPGDDTQYVETYCDCPCGAERQRLETTPP